MEATQAEQHYLLTSDNMKPRWILIEYWVVGRLCFRVFPPRFFTWVLTVRALIQTLSVTERIKANGLKVGVSSVSPHTHTCVSSYQVIAGELLIASFLTFISREGNLHLNSAGLDAAWMPKTKTKSINFYILFKRLNAGISSNQRALCLCQQCPFSHFSAGNDCVTLCPKVPSQICCLPCKAFHKRTKSSRLSPPAAN